VGVCVRARASTKTTFRVQEPGEGSKHERREPGIPLPTRKLLSYFSLQFLKINQVERFKISPYKIIFPGIYIYIYIALHIKFSNIKIHSRESRSTSN